MYSYYLKIAWRNLLKTPLFSFINIAGLSVGLAAGILVLLWVSDELRYDKFHRNLSEIHVILQTQVQGGQSYTFESLPGPLAAALRAEVPEVKYAARGSWSRPQQIQFGDKSTNERSIFAEPDFLKIFQFPVLKGDAVAALADVGSVVITERVAQKFFGSEDPIGKIMQYNNSQPLKVGAVLANVPKNSSVQFDILLPFRIYALEMADWIDDAWGNNSLPTWVSLHDHTDLAALNAKLANFIQSKEPGSPVHIFAYPLSEWRLHNRFKDGKPSGGRIAMAYILGSIGVILLLIACVNFMNLSTARSEKRAREVGVMKAVGALRRQLISQFLCEAMVMTTLALLLGFVLSWLALPLFNRYFGKALSLADFNGAWAWAVVGMALFTGLVAGSYPSFFLSRFSPLVVLKGVDSRGKGGSGLRKALVTFQFFISIALILTTIVLYRQLKHIESRPIGYDQEHLIQIPVRGEMNKTFGALKADLLTIPGVKSVAGSSDDLISYGSNTSGIQWPGKTDDQDFLVTLSWVSQDWVKTTGLNLLEGREFAPGYGNDSLSCLVNKAAVERMGLKSPVLGTVLEFDTSATIIGVVDNFIFNDPTKKVGPMVVYLGSSNNFNSFFVKIDNNGRWEETLAQVEKSAKKLNPATPFEFHFVKEQYEAIFEEGRTYTQIAQVFGGLAIFISCLGLFGLSAFVAERRRKEISIRKVLGASFSQIWMHLSGDFFMPVLWAFLLAVAPTVWALNNFLKELDYRIEISSSMVLLAGILALVIAFLTVSFQGIRAALGNPVSALKSE